MNIINISDADYNKTLEQLNNVIAENNLNINIQELLKSLNFKNIFFISQDIAIAFDIKYGTVFVASYENDEVLKMLDEKLKEYNYDLDQIKYDHDEVIFFNNQ